MINWFILIPVAILLIALVIFIIKRNQKDEQAFEDQLNNDYPTPTEDENDVNAEEITT